MSLKGWIADFLGITQQINSDITLIREQGTQIYYKELAINTAISLIANAIAKCEIKVYNNDEEVQNQIYYELNVQPNKNENSSQLWHKAIEKLIYNGECIIVNVGNELYVADSYCVDEYPINGNIYSSVMIGNLSLNKIFKHNEVFRLKLNNTNIKALLDGLSQDYEDLLSLSIKKYKNSNQQKYILELEQIKASDEAFQRNYRNIIQKQLKEWVESDNGVYPQYKGYNLRDVSNNANVSSDDFREIRRDMVEVVAQAFGIPVDLLFGDVNNLDDVTNQFLTFTIDPLADMISEELSRKIYAGYDNYKRGNRIVVDTNSILHIDTLDIADKADKLIASGTCNINEIRKLIGMNPLDGEYAECHYITKNYDLADNMLKTLEEGGEKDEEDS